MSIKEKRPKNSLKNVHYTKYGGFIILFTKGIIH